MTRTAALIVFLVFQVAMGVVWYSSLVPLVNASGESASFYAETAQVWSRSGDSSDAAAAFDPVGGMLFATLLISGGGLSVAIGWLAFCKGKGALAAGMLALALGLAASGAWLISRQWAAATLFPAGAVDTGWLYTITRTWLLHFYLTFALVVAFIGLTIAEISTAGRPRGFHLVALNWMIVVVIWVTAYLTLYLAPSLGRGA